MEDSVTNSAVEYQVQISDDITDAVITGYEVVRFGVPMIGEYVNTGRGRRVAISPAVPGVLYRTAAWALGDGRRSATPAVAYVNTGKASESGRHKMPSTSSFYKEYWVFLCFLVLVQHTNPHKSVQGRRLQ